MIKINLCIWLKDEILGFKFQHKNKATQSRNLCFSMISAITQVPTKIITTKFLPFCTNAWSQSFRRFVLSLISRTPQEKRLFPFTSFIEASFYVFQFGLVLWQDTKNSSTAQAENRKSASFNQVFPIRVWSLKYMFNILTFFDPWHGQRRLSSPRVFSTSSHL